MLNLFQTHLSMSFILIPNTARSLLIQHYVSVAPYNHAKAIQKIEQGIGEKTLQSNFM